VKAQLMREFLLTTADAPNGWTAPFASSRLADDSDFSHLLQHIIQANFFYSYNNYD